MIGLSDVKNSRTYQELVALNSPFSNPYVSKLPHDDNKDFSPRVGFAYDLPAKASTWCAAGSGSTTETSSRTFRCSWNR